jgi:hypothetical protein
MHPPHSSDKPGPSGDHPGTILRTAPSRRPHGGAADVAFTQFVVTEVVAVGSLFSDDAPLPHLIKCLHQHVFVDTADLFKHLEGERSTDDGCNIDQFSESYATLLIPNVVC